MLVVLHVFDETLYRLSANNMDLHKTHYYGSDNAYMSKKLEISLSQFSDLPISIVHFGLKLFTGSFK